MDLTARSNFDHPQHPYLRQMKPHRHNIGSHRGPPGSLTLNITDPSTALTPTQGPSTTPLPMNSRRLKILDHISRHAWAIP